MKIETNQIAGRDLKNGMAIWVQGHPMIVSNVRLEWQGIPQKSEQLVRFTGTCTGHVCNDSIRHTSYNGGTYGQLAHMNYTIAALPAATVVKCPFCHGTGEAHQTGVVCRACHGDKHLSPQAYQSLVGTLPAS
jgi:DnaJ-class molecular chaperone